MFFINAVSTKHIKDYQIELTFNDGTHGIVDLKGRLYGEVFEPLLDVQQFKKITLNSWTIEWANWADLSPDLMPQTRGVR